MSDNNTTELEQTGTLSTSTATKKTPRKPSGLTERERLECFIRENSHELAYRPDARMWLHFDGNLWREDKDGVRATELAAETTQAAFDELEPNQQAAVEHRWLAMTFPERLTHAATRRRAIRVESELWDAQPHLLGCANGVLDLKTGELLTGRPELRVSRSTGLVYDPAATCPRFDRFLEEVQPNSPDVHAHLQRMAGYLLTGSTSVQKMWLLYGQGANGKTVLTETLLTMLGEYGQKGPSSVMLGRETHGGPRTDLTRLEGARLVALSETDKQDRFSEARLKELTGGERIAARPLYQSEVEFTPQAKFLLTTNELPRVQGTDEGIWRRLIVVPFEQHFSSPDPLLKAALREELPGILAWAVRGALAFYTAGEQLTVPPQLEMAGKSYRSQQDTLSLFLEERCVLAPGAFVATEDLKEAYQRWCTETDRTALPWQSTVAPQLHSRGLTREKRGKANRWGWSGMSLLSEDDREGGATQLTVAA